MGLSSTSAERPWQGEREGVGDLALPPSPRAPPRGRRRRTAVLKLAATLERARLGSGFPRPDQGGSCAGTMGPRTSLSSPGGPPDPSRSDRICWKFGVPPCPILSPGSILPSARLLDESFFGLQGISASLSKDLEERGMHSQTQRHASS